MHRRTASQRHLTETGMSHSLGPHLSQFAPSSPSNGILANFIDLFFPRKSRQRATLLCLMSLVVLTTYICLVSPPTLAPGQSPHRHHHSAEDAWRQLVDKIPRPPPPPGGFHNHRPEIILSPEQELGAVTAFMAALPQNVIPPDVDPTEPIDPQLVLDFDTRSPRAEEEVDNVVSDVWLRNPVVVFSKVKCLSFIPPMRPFPPHAHGSWFIFYSLVFFYRLRFRQTVSPVSRELKSILDEMHLNPSPTIFGVDQRGGYPQMCSFSEVGPLTYTP